MAKKRNKSKTGAVSMDIATDASEDLPQAIDTSEGKTSNPALGVSRKIKKGAPIRRSKNVRKQKAIDKAISKGQQSEEKFSKKKNKLARVQAAKSLYE
ncbi:hypothetical protein H6P81_005659 [Aristolochia fimbriata]|uniref:Uncharacterized protein n=1 Tax=Aristolochia fimbriata TaxID=158543 RepID=A0AAV7EX93_ARIFI|nr:hypothetical protein H6P81_005659 [Aristolochia fimbriata]